MRKFKLKQKVILLYPTDARIRYMRKIYYYKKGKRRIISNPFYDVPEGCNLRGRIVAFCGDDTIYMIKLESGKTFFYLEELLRPADTIGELLYE